MRTLAIGVAVNLLLLNCGWAANAAQGNHTPNSAAATSNISSELLRFQLEHVYRDVRAAVESKDYATYLRLVIPARSGKPPPQEAFDKIAVRLLDDYPALEWIQFVKVDRSGDWAGYYTEDRSSNINLTYVRAFNFKRAGQGWKMSSRVIVQAIPQVNGQFRTLNEIALNPIFRLPGQRGYREPQK